MNRDILRIAIPSIVTNITVPMLGFVDLSIVGHISAASAIGAISVGTLVFNMVYWLFNFLRMGSSGLTAQAYGRGDEPEQRRVLFQSVVIALVCGLSVILLQRPIEMVAHVIVSPSDEVWLLAVRYFRIRVWAAPAVLILFSMNGWYVGMQNSRIPMYIAVGQNLVNILASFLLVFYGGMGIEGVALGTVISQYVGMAAAFWFCRATLVRALGERGRGGTWSRFFTVNRDIFLRMVCIISVTCSFTAIGARMNDTLLAVNTLLMQFFTLFSYFSDGFALAGEALTGRFIGASDAVRLQRCIRSLFAWGFGVMAVFTVLYYCAGTGVLRLLTDDQSVIAASEPYLLWSVMIPLCGIGTFMWDGIYVGATATRQMLYSLVFGVLVFFGCYFLLPYPQSDNHRLWLSFLMYLLTRSLSQTLMSPRCIKLRPQDK